MTKPTRPGDDRIAETILALAAERGRSKSICPSEAARALGGSQPEEWSLLMQPVRRAAVALMKAGRLVILRKGKPIDDPDDFKGVYRLALPPEDGDCGPGNHSSV